MILDIVNAILNPVVLITAATVNLVLWAAIYRLNGDFLKDFTRYDALMLTSSVFLMAVFEGLTLLVKLDVDSLLVLVAMSRIMRGSIYINLFLIGFRQFKGMLKSDD